jgi:hypothetical protein
LAVSTPEIWLELGWYPSLKLDPENPDVTVSALRERVVSTLGWRFEEYHPNDPNEGTRYYSIFPPKSWMVLTIKKGEVASVGADWRDIPLLLRIADLYGAKRRGWRWPLYWLRYGLGGKRQSSG